MIMRKSAHKDVETPAGQTTWKPPKYLRDIIQRMEDDESVKATYNITTPDQGDDSGADDELYARIAAALGLKPKASYDEFLAAIEAKIATYLDRRQPQDVDVLDRELLAPAEVRAQHTKQWIVQYPNGLCVYFDTEDEACAMQRAHRAACGLDEQTGEAVEPVAEEREAFERWYVKFYNEPLPHEWQIIGDWECWKASRAALAAVEPAGYVYSYVGSDNHYEWSFEPSSPAWTMPTNTPEAAERGVDRRFAVYAAPQVAVSGEVSDTLALLVECRDAFPVPPPGSPLEQAWAQAMGEPECIPDYLRAAVLALAGSGGKKP